MRRQRVSTSLIASRGRIAVRGRIASRGRTLAVLGFAIALLAPAACGSSSNKGTTAAPGKPDKVNTGVIAIVDVAPIYLGKQQGFFSKRNIDLALNTAQGGAVIVPSVVSGQYQFGFSNVTSLLLAQANGLPLKVVANGVASTGQQGKDFGAVVVKNDSPIKTAADLAGHSVSVNNLKNIGDTTIRASVRKAGGDPKAIKFVELSFPDAPPALQAGRVDAIFVVEPFLTIALNQGARIVASPYVDPAPNLTVATYFTTTQLATSNPDLVARFTAAMKESLQYADSHPDAVRGVLNTYTQIAGDVRAKLTLPKWPTDINRQAVQTLADLATGDGLLTKAPDLNALLPSS
jgi:NitT/TauT family transport system substrate-binding protein